MMMTMTTISTVQNSSDLKAQHTEAKKIYNFKKN